MNEVISFSEARANLAKIWDEVIDNREIKLLSRRGKEDIALIPADELSGLLESVHLLRSPKNAKRIRQSLEKVYRDEGEVITIDMLKVQLLE